MASVVFDVGKTHAKLFLLDNTTVLAQRECRNVLLDVAPYPHYDIAGLWRFLHEGLMEFSRLYVIEKICITTHGATAALVDSQQVLFDPASATFGLVLPVLDYEYRQVETLNARYQQLRPDFSQSFSPELPAGLNLGRQLFWLANTFPEAFDQADTFLLYPQYWAWLLCGEAATEISSLGCHTDLWSVDGGCWSSLVTHNQWQSLFPPMRAAWEVLGGLRPELQTCENLQSCQVYVGVHDSNASYLRYKRQANKKDFTVFSTGTWCIAMASSVVTKNLQADKDMLANVDVFAEPIVCSRFMGGREFSLIASMFESPLDTFTEESIQSIIDNSIFALPDFSDGSGPLAKQPGRVLNNDGETVTGAQNDLHGMALATLYCALMMDYQLDLLKSEGEVFIEGAFTQNPLLCAVLAQLRPERNVYISKDIAGTVMGCAQLMDWKKSIALDLLPVNPANFKHLQRYKMHWRERLQ